MTPTKTKLLQRNSPFQWECEDGALLQVIDLVGGDLPPKPAIGVEVAYTKGPMRTHWGTLKEAAATEEPQIDPPERIARALESIVESLRTIANRMSNSR